MLMDLFSSFDPTTYILGVELHLNWISSSYGLMLLPNLFWINLNRFQVMFFFILKTLSNEFKLVLSGNKISGYFLFNALFMMLLFNNMMGLLPYVFTSSSHLAFTLTFSLILWLSFMLYGWINHTESMFCHLVPNGTPSVLMPFMVCIETISNMIRSGTLSVRLTANMISGHLLLTLMGNQGPSLNLFLIGVLTIFQTLLMTLELSVSIIQSYVFSILSALYSSESTGVH